MGRWGPRWREDGWVWGILAVEHGAVPSAGRARWSCGSTSTAWPLVRQGGHLRDVGGSSKTWGASLPRYGEPPPTLCPLLPRALPHQ